MSATVKLPILLTSAEAMAFAQFLKRIGYSDYRAQSVDEAEAYHMVAAGAVIQRALAEAGYAPR